MSQQDDSTSEPEKPPPSQETNSADGNTDIQNMESMKGAALVSVITGLSLAAFLIALDTSIVATVRFP
jgi:hypothetical protein